MARSVMAARKRPVTVFVAAKLVSSLMNRMAMTMQTRKAAAVHRAMAVFTAAMRRSRTARSERAAARRSGFSGVV